MSPCCGRPKPGVGPGDQSRAVARQVQHGPGHHGARPPPPGYDDTSDDVASRKQGRHSHHAVSPAGQHDLPAAGSVRNHCFMEQLLAGSAGRRAVGPGSGHTTPKQQTPPAATGESRSRASQSPAVSIASGPGRRHPRPTSQSPAARVGGIPVQRRLAQDCAPRGRSRRTRRRVGPLPEQQAPPCARQRGADCVAKATAVTAAATAADDGAPPVEVTGGAATATLSAVSSALATAAGDGAELGRRRRRQGRWQRRGLRRQQRGWWWWRRRRPGRQQRRPGVGNGPLSRAAGTLTATSAIILPGGGQRRGRRATAFTGSTLIRDGVPRCIETVFRLGRHRVCARHAAAPSSATNQNRKYCSRRTWPPAASARRG